MKTVVVGMSGGVDSSLSAALLQEQGMRVIGLFMKNWEDRDAQGSCPAAREYEDVARVCDQLQIPHYSVNFVQEYRDRVFASFLADLKEGLTPNPDVLCNREIKFDLFLEKAISLGADFLATGHYCRLDEKGRLLKGIDPDKDQSYFLHAVKQGAFRNVLFPVGHLYKRDVRALAKKWNLATAEKKDSTGICFIGKRDFKPFVARYLQDQSGPFQTLNGQEVGRHDGAPFYTIGQRRGLGLGGEGDAWYVVGKNLSRNIVFVERGAHHPALFASSLMASRPTWIAEPPNAFPYRCAAKIRYRQQDQPCTLYEQEGGWIHVVFDEPQRAITPGQSVVFYQDDLCMGGCLIHQAGNLG